MKPPVAAAGLLPGRAFTEERVVQGLDLKQALARLRAGADPGQVTEVLESLDAGGDYDQQVGVARGCGRECMRQSWRDHGEVSFAGDVDSASPASS